MVYNDEYCQMRAVNEADPRMYEEKRRSGSER